MAVFKIDVEDVPAMLGMGAEVRARMGGENRDVPKLAPNGKQTFVSGVVVAREDGGLDRSVSVAVCEPPAEPYALGTLLRADGAAWLVPYVTNDKRQGLSITVERLVPVDVKASAPSPQFRRVENS